MKHIIIAIDGHSSTGKSTIAKQLAKKFEFVYVDTGAMYRAVTLFAMDSNLVSSKGIVSDTLIQRLDEIHLDFRFNKDLGYAEMYLNGKNVERKIRSIEVSNMVSFVSEISEVRKKLVQQQQEMGTKASLVMDGRDIGTVVYPNADIKLFVTASAKVRAERRFKELQSRGDNVSFEEILENVQTRDHIDSTRKDSPLLKAHDAIEIDNSEMSMEEQFLLISNLVSEKLGNS